jgi:hypothetical protein
MKAWVVYGHWGLSGVSIEGTYTSEAMAQRVLAAFQSARFLSSAPYGGWHKEEVELDMMPTFHEESQTYAQEFQKAWEALG